MDPTACLMMDDDLLDFSLDAGDGDEDEDKTKAPSSSSLEFSNPDCQHPDGFSPSFPEFVEEELEWLSNKDAFPAVETCLDILSDRPLTVVTNHRSPVSVLENSSCSINSNSTTASCCGSLQVPVRYPVRARSKRRRSRRRGFPELPSQQCWRWNQVNVGRKQKLPLPAPLPRPLTAASNIVRRCQHCLAERTPQWRAGPLGPKTLCNACGVRYKSGRLVPEYRPASSPTFSSLLHSNSHRKVMEMRKHRQLGGVMVNEVCGCEVG